MRRWVPLAAAVLLVSTAAPVAAQEERPVEVRFADGGARVSFDATGLIDEELGRELRSGLRKRVVVSVAIVSGRNSSPLAERRFGCGITYDLWQDRFVVDLGRRALVYASVDEAVARCLDVHDLAVGTAALARGLAGRRYRVVVQAEFEPLPAERCRALLRQSGSSDSIGPIFVSVVRREICSAERTYVFRSPALRGPPEGG